MAFSSIESNETSRDAGSKVGSQSIRFIAEQPSLAKYRLSVYQELARRPGIDFTLLYGKTPGIPNVEPIGFDGQFVPMKHRTFAGQIIRWHRAQWQAAGRKDGDVLLMSWNARYLSLIPSLLRARWHGKPVILWGHGYSKREHGFRKIIRQSITRLATALLLYDRRTADRLVESGMPREKVFVAPNAIDQTPIAEARQTWLADPQRFEHFRDEHDLRDRQVLLYVSRLDQNNRLDLLLEATVKLRERFPRLVTILIGGGDEERARLQTHVDRLQLAGQVQFLGGIYDERELAHWFLVADAFVYPENIGLSILHAFGYGVPVVTCDAIERQNPEIVALQQEFNGLLYKEGSLPDLTATIARLLVDRALRDRMSAAALKTAHEDFTVPRMVDGFVEAIAYCQSQRQ
jgi:glycosyltransferase involved in cell wall biosynthesis